jgi:hypothetical protein
MALDAQYSIDLIDGCADGVRPLLLDNLTTQVAPVVPSLDQVVGNRSG